MPVRSAQVDAAPSCDLPGMDDGSSVGEVISSWKSMPWMMVPTVGEVISSWPAVAMEDDAPTVGEMVSPGGRIGGVLAFHAWGLVFARQVGVGRCSAIV